MSPGALAIRAPASAEESAGITPRERGSDSSGVGEATQCTTRHSWPNALFLLKRSDGSLLVQMGNSAWT